MIRKAALFSSRQKTTPIKTGENWVWHHTQNNIFPSTTSFGRTSLGAKFYNFNFKILTSNYNVSTYFEDRKRIFRLFESVLNFLIVSLEIEFLNAFNHEVTFLRALVNPVPSRMRVNSSAMNQDTLVSRKKNMVNTVLSLWCNAALHVHMSTKYKQAVNTRPFALYLRF